MSHRTDDNGKVIDLLDSILIALYNIQDALDKIVGALPLAVDRELAVDPSRSTPKTNPDDA